jgi:hypothetical protein
MVHCSEQSFVSRVDFQATSFEYRYVDHDVLSVSPKGCVFGIAKIGLTGLEVQRY